MKISILVIPLILIAIKFNPVANLQFGPCPRPPNFPPIMRFTIRTFENFDRGVRIPFAYVVTPRFPEEVVTLANWAYQYGYRVRAIGSSHSWSPLHFAPSDSGAHCPHTILVDTTKYFTTMTVNPTDYGRPDLHSVTVGTGIQLQHLLQFLEENGLGVFATPTIGTVTVGGMLAIAAHGSGMPSKFDEKSTGHTFGTLSNLIIDMTIVSWNPATSSYRLKTLFRWDKDCKAFLANLGRTIVTSVTLRVGRNQNLRSQSHFFIPAHELFANPYEAKEDTRTIAKFADAYGRVNPICIGSTKLIWMKTWKTEPLKPPSSRAVYGPYNYYFINYFPESLDPLVHNLLNRMPSLPQSLSSAAYITFSALLKLIRSIDYWGASKNILLYLPSFSPRMTAYSFTILTSKANMQLVLWVYKSHFDKLYEEYAEKGHFPVPFETNFRITGVDNPEDVEVPGAESPSLSPASPNPEYPNYDTVIWIETSAYNDTPSGLEFMFRLQNRLVKDVHERIGLLRVEWAKGWAFTMGGTFTNASIMGQLLPRGFSSSDRMEEWNWAINKLDSYDPHRIFSNSFLDNLLSVH